MKVIRGGLSAKVVWGDREGAEGSITLGRVGRGGVNGISGGDHAGGGDLGRGCSASAVLGSDDRSVGAGAGGCGRGRDLPGEELDGLKWNRDQGTVDNDQVTGIAKSKIKTHVR